MIFMLIAGIDMLCQPIYTKDNLFIGYRDELISDCLEGSKSKYFTINNRIIDKYFYCVCICDELLPSLMLKKKNYKLIDPCIAHYAAVSDAFSFDNGQLTENERQVYVQMCIEANTAFFTFEPLASDLKIRGYCECIITSMLENGYSYTQFNEMSDPGSEAFNIVYKPCSEEIFDVHSPIKRSISYDPEDIVGNDSSSEIILSDYLGRNYQVKISIDGVTGYYFFDTGASFLLINKEVERKLVLNGSLTKDDYGGIEYFAMANNELVEARLVTLNNVMIGDYNINNVEAAIIEDGALLCGMSLLNKFKNWQVNKDENTLILYK